MSQVEYLQSELYKAKMDNKALEQELEKILQVIDFSACVLWKLTVRKFKRFHRTMSSFWTTSSARA
jgi:hypothetical protein